MSRLVRIPLSPARLVFLVVHMLLAVVALVGAFVIRFYLRPFSEMYVQMMWLSLPWAVASKAIGAELAGLTRVIWRYASFQDIRQVFFANLIGSFLFVPACYLLVSPSYPKGPLLLDFLLCFCLFAGFRFSGRACTEGLKGFRGFQRTTKLPVLILGAGDEGELALRYLWHSTVRPLRVVGFLDDNWRLHGHTLHGVPVLGNTGEMERIIRDHGVREVVVALPGPRPAELRELFRSAVENGCRVGILPKLSMEESTVHASPIRDVKLSDFLGRDPVELDPAPVREGLAGQRVMVTGAGGSIGAELCRQIATAPVGALLLLDNAENPLFEITEEISSIAPQLKLESLLCDIRFQKDLDTVFQSFRPTVVFHAAACKHVPMMELHPVDAARTNVLGTRNVVGACLATGVERLLHVSTDKAVEATGLMGASKALSEQVVRQAARNHGKRYACVRFGNVLGSNGSVIPLFEKQLKRGGPLKVTHREATRYFMTLEEAVDLMLHAEALGGEGETFILDMGEPVSILKLAEQMLQLSGLHTQDGGGIEIVGLRPGERLHERLYSEAQTLEPTRIPKVNRLVEEPVTGDPQLDRKLERLAEAVNRLDGDKVRTLLQNEKHFTE